MYLMNAFIVSDVFEKVLAVLGIGVFLIGATILVVLLVSGWAIGLFIRTKRSLGALAAIAAVPGARNKAKAAAAFAAATAVTRKKGKP